MDFKEFCRQLQVSRYIYRWFPNHLLFCGSAFELPLFYVISNPTDFDVILCDNDLIAVSKSENAPSRFTGTTTLRIETENCCMGFAKLLISNSDGSSDFFIKPSFSPVDYLHGPAYTNVFMSVMPTAVETFVKGFFPKWMQYDKYTIDLVYAVYCPKWPQEAIEWKTRVRKNGWPPENVVQQVVNVGCHLVAKPHHTKPDDNTEWRYSFSKAEIMLINTWTEVQKYIYHILRLIKSEVVKECIGDYDDESKALCTYYFKMLMFWAIEDKSPEFWSEQRVVLSVHELLCDMTTKLIDRDFPNYFFRDINMMDHLLTVCVDQQVTAIVEFDERRICKITSMFPKAISEIHVTVSIQHNAVLCYLMQAFDCSLHSAFAPGLKSSLSYKASESDETITAQKYLHRAIETQLRINRLTTPNSEQSKIQRALTLFRKAMTESEDTRSSKLKLSPTDSFYEFLTKAIASFNSSSSSSHTGDCHDDATVYLRYPITIITRDMCGLGRYFTSNNIISGHSLDEEYVSQVRVLKQKISCLIFQCIPYGAAYRHMRPIYITASVYEANFYYATLKYYSEAIARYDEFLEFIKQKHLRLKILELAARTFPIIIASNWSQIFDAHIQSVFGFLTLSKAIFLKQQGRSENRSPSSSKTILRLCPILLFMYIRFQAERLGCKSTNHAVLNDINNFPLTSILNRTKAHRGFSRLILLAALRSSGVNCNTLLSCKS